jgi:chaperonin GroES
VGMAGSPPPAEPAIKEGYSGRPGRQPTRMRYRAIVASKDSSSQAGASKQPITVLFDRVLVQVAQAEGERRSRAGILSPATAQVSRRLAWAETVAVGPHVRAVKPGDKVLFNPEDRFEVEVQGEEYVILRERDIHAVASERIDSGTGLYL